MMKRKLDKYETQALIQYHADQITGRTMLHRPRKKELIDHATKILVLVKTLPDEPKCKYSGIV